MIRQDNDLFIAALAAIRDEEAPWENRARLRAWRAKYQAIETAEPIPPRTLAPTCRAKRALRQAVQTNANIIKFPAYRGQLGTGKRTPSGIAPWRLQ